MTPQIVLMIGEMPEWQEPGNVRSSSFRLHPSVAVYLVLGNRRLCLSGRVYRSVGSNIAVGDTGRERAFIERVRHDHTNDIMTKFGANGAMAVTHETVRELMEGFTTALDPNLLNASIDVAGLEYEDRWTHSDEARGYPGVIATRRGWGRYDVLRPAGAMRLFTDMQRMYEPQRADRILLGVQNQPTRSVEGVLHVTGSLRRRVEHAQRFVNRWLGSVKDASGQPFNVPASTRFLHALDTLWLAWFLPGYETRQPLPTLREVRPELEWEHARFAFPNYDRSISLLMPVWLEVHDARRVDAQWSPQTDDAYILNHYFQKLLGLNVEVLTTERWPWPDSEAELRIED